jgi:hypothetical protein
MGEKAESVGGKSTPLAEARYELKSAFGEPASPRLHQRRP